MEEPSDSSRQRAPDLTTFLVTSYEHLRLKTPLISRIHKARLVLNRRASIDVQLFREVQQKQTDKELHARLLASPTGRKWAAQCPDPSQTQMWSIVETNTFRPHLFWECDKLTTVSDGVILHIKALDIFKSKLFGELTARVTQSGAQSYRHHIVIKKAGLVILDQTIDACYPWIFLKETWSQDAKLREESAIYRNILDRCPVGHEICFSQGVISLTELSTGKTLHIHACQNP